MKILFPEEGNASIPQQRLRGNAFPEAMRGIQPIVRDANVNFPLAFSLFAQTMALGGPPAVRPEQAIHRDPRLRVEGLFQANPSTPRERTEPSSNTPSNSPR